MKTKKICFLFAIFFFTLPSFSQTEGGMEGGGGKTVVCRDPNGKINSAEVLDLFEGRAVYKLAYEENKTEWKTQGNNIIEKSHIPMADPPQIVEWYQNAIDHLVILPSGVTLKPIDDSLEPINPPAGCAVEQTVNYQSDNRILINGDIWSVLSETQKAALILHEATYRHLRNYGEKDSRRARHFIAFIFSGGTIQDTWPENSNDAPVICGPTNSHNLSVFVVPIVINGEKNLRFYFTSLNRLLLSRSYIDIQMDSENDDFAEQLVHPTEEIHYFPVKSVSNFEDGDKIGIGLWKNDRNLLAPFIVGTSIVDESPIEIELHCIRRASSKK